MSDVDSLTAEDLESLMRAFDKLCTELRQYQANSHKIIEAQKSQSCTLAELTADFRMVTQDLLQIVRAFEDHWPQAESLAFREVLQRSEGTAQRDLCTGDHEPGIQHSQAGSASS